MGLSGLLNTARSGIIAQSGALTVTGANVANATTPGYSKRIVDLSTVVDGGVVYGGMTRAFNRFSFATLVDQQGQKGAAAARASALANIEGVIAPPDNTIGDRSTALVTAFNTLAANPTDPTVRADVLSKADDFATTIATASQGLTQSSKDLFSQAQAVVGQINTKLASIADLNSKIANAQAEGTDSTTLRDQRDLWIQDVAQHIGVKSVEDPQGRVTLFAAGAALVNGPTSSPLSVDLTTAGAIRVTVQGAGTNDVTSRVDSGQLGGIIQARDVDLAAARTNLDKYAFDAANAFNAVHSAGYGSDGGTGRNLFTAPLTQAGAAALMSVDASMVGQPGFIAAAGSSSELPGGNSAAEALSQLGDQNAFGGTTLANSFAVVAGDVGTRKASADSESKLRDDTLTLAQNTNDSTSGVSIDEEMVDMTRYQRAFEASSKLLKTADDLLNGFLSQF